MKKKVVISISFFFSGDRAYALENFKKKKIPEIVVSLKKAKDKGNLFQTFIFIVFHKYIALSITYLLKQKITCK